MTTPLKVNHKNARNIITMFYYSFIHEVQVHDSNAPFALLGIAPNMMLAKVCSDKNKPNGQYRLPCTREAVMDFVQNLPVRKVQYTLLKLKHKQSPVVLL